MADLSNTNNYTLPRGEIHFSRFKANTQEPQGFDYIGNTPEFAISIETEELEHFNSDCGIREKDDSITLEVDRTGNMVTDNISPENISLFLFGQAQSLVQAAVVDEEETLSAVLSTRSYILGISATNPIGYRGVDPASIVVTDAGATTTYTAATDYTWDEVSDTLRIVEGGAIAESSDIVVTFSVRASTRSAVRSGSVNIEGALRYVARPPKGKPIHYYFPYVRISPNGDLNLKGDEWQQIPLNLEILKPSAGEAIYADGAPAFT